MKLAGFKHLHRDFQSHHRVDFDKVGGQRSELTDRIALERRQHSRGDGRTHLALDEGVDAAYEAAILEFEKAAPTTPRGVTLKTKLLWQRLRALFQGDQLTPSGRQMMRAFYKTIDGALAHLAKQGRYAGFRW